ncbi:hypothetical protein RCL1_008999 [Eukaryota sp. TZLM3-RCL]
MAPKRSTSSSSQPKKRTNSSTQDQEYGSFPISSTRSVSIRSFKNTLLIDIREHYTDSEGEIKPGKKGISLSLEQYRELLKVLPDVSACIDRATGNVEEEETSEEESSESED